MKKSLWFVLALAAWSRVAAAEIDYEPPKLLVGTLYEMNSGTNKILFSSKRTSTRSNATVHVLCDYLYPNGSLAAREDAVFEHGQLTFFGLDEKQTGDHGSAKVGSDPKNSAKQKMFFEWITSDGKKKTDSEVLQRDTLIGDMIPYFIVEHWNELAGGDAVSFRFIALDRCETVGFKLVKEGEISAGGRAALRLRMEASNFVIRQLVDPIFFIVEKDGAHRVLEYIGRTTPMKREGNKWKDLDARTIYDWK